MPPSWKVVVMPRSTAPQPAADRNLRYGILALQMDFISRDALIAAMHSWVLDKARPLSDLLLETKALGRDEYDLLDALVHKHLEKHGNDAERSLAAISPAGPIRQDLGEIADPELQASLGFITVRGGGTDDPYATQAPSAGIPTSAGSRFRILRPHSRGGLGQVYVARDEELHREVGLKEIHERHADDPGSRARFLLEAGVTGGLEHPGIVPVYGLGSYADGRSFYAMRFIKGDSLNEAITHFHRAEGAGRDPGERALELRQLLGRFVDVCNAVAYAHSRGVLHRDLKPGNIMLGQYGETLVVDWGLAKLGGQPAEAGRAEDTLRPSSATGLTQTQMGAAVGTPHYMSPEQAAGRLDELGPASDVYSLGATLYHLLTGQAPLEGEDAGEVLRKAQRGDYPPPRRVKPAVPAALEAICLKAMALTPGDRYPSPRALADDIEHWLADEPVHAWPEPWAVRTRRWLGRHRTLVTAAAAALLVAGLGLAAATVLLSAANGRLAAANADEREARGREGQARDREREALRAAERSLYAAHVNLAERAWHEGHPALVEELLRLHLPRPGEEDPRGFEWHYLWRLCHPNVRTLRSDGSALTLAFSGDGTRLVCATQNGIIRVWDPDTGRRLLSLTLPWKQGPPHAAACSPDGTRLAAAFSVSFREPCLIKLFDLGTGKELTALRAHPRRVEALAFSPDGRQLASGGTDGTIKLWDVAAGKELASFQGSRLPLSCLCFQPGGAGLASGDALGTVKLWGAEHKEVFSLSNQAGRVRGLSFTPDGARLVTATEGRGGGGFSRLAPEVKVWDVKKKRLLFGLHEHARRIEDVTCSPDGTRLAAAGGDLRTNALPGEVKVWDASGREVANLRGHEMRATRVAFRPGAAQLATAAADGTVRVWTFPTGQEPLVLRGHVSGVPALAFSPDGKLLASSGSDFVRRVGQLKVWQVETGKELFSLPGHAGMVRAVPFSPDGQTLASGADDKTVRLWDVVGRRERRVLRGHEGMVTGVAFGPRGPAWPPPATTRPFASGTPATAGRCTPCAPRPSWSAWRSARTAPPWPRWARTGRCASGTPPPAGRSSRSRSRRACCARWPTAPTASGSPWPAWAGR
jgi:WD40 repeat protein/tRNA A-37 threonylcarbamoyl transferase component Bud32